MLLRQPSNVLRFNKARSDGLLVATSPHRCRTSNCLMKSS